MRVKESKFYHARISKKNTAKLKRIAAKTGRGLNTEANLAVANHKPRLVFRDNGR